MRDSAHTDIIGPMSCSVERVTGEEVSGSTRSQFTCSVPPACSSTCHTASYCMTHCVSQPCMPVSNIGPTRILPYLYLGSQRDALCQETLTKNGITYIVNVTTSIPRPSFIQETNFHRIPIDDTYLDKLVPFFQEAFQFLDKVREANACVLVHCLAGVSRSATLVIAYVMSQLGLTTEEAYRYVKEKRPTISPNFNFLGQLVEFEQQLQSTHEHLRRRFCCSSGGATQPLCCSSARSGCDALAGSVPCSGHLGLPGPVTTVAELSKMINSPTTAMSRLSFANLSPLQEHTTPPGDSQTPPTSKPSHNGAAGEAGIVLALSQSGSGGGVTIRLGAKHNYAGSKRPLSSPTFGAGHGAADESEGGGGSSMKQKRPMERPNSIGIVPVGGLGRPGEGWNFSTGKSELSWLSRRSSRIASRDTDQDSETRTLVASGGCDMEKDKATECFPESGTMENANVENNTTDFAIPVSPDANCGFKFNCDGTGRGSGNQSMNYGYNVISNHGIPNKSRKRVLSTHPKILVSQLLTTETDSVTDYTDMQSSTAQDIGELSPMESSCNHHVTDTSSSNSSLNLSPTRKTRSLDDMLETSGECLETNSSLLTARVSSSNSRQHKHKATLCETRSLGREFARISKDKRKAMIFHADRAHTAVFLPSPVSFDMRVCASIMGERSATSLDYTQNSPLRDSPSTLHGSADMIQVS